MFYATSALEGSSSTINADLSYFLGATLYNSSAATKATSSTSKRIKAEHVDTDAASSSVHDKFGGVRHRLCQPIEDYGKSAVMALSNHGKPPRFSKYVGALEWKNCVYLWVNLGGKSGYSNVFTEHGRHMMWFGGSKMHKGNNIVLRVQWTHAHFIYPYT